MCGSPMSSKADRKRQQQYQAEDDCRTLQHADEVRGDKGRHGRARAHAKKQLRSFRSIAGGRR